MKVFIGSSTEQRRLVEWLTDFINREYPGKVEPIPWTLHWRGGEYTLENLEQFVKQTDAAVLFLTADDRTWYRETVRHEPRDNLIFEAGLFLGQHGRNRTQLFVPDYGPHDDDKRRVAVPSDLTGLTVNHFTWRDGHVDATGLPAKARSVFDILQELGPRPRTSGELEFLASDSQFEQVNSYVGPFFQAINTGIQGVIGRRPVRSVDILVAYRIGDVRRALSSCRKQTDCRLRMCLANMWDDDLVRLYQRKYFDRTADQIRTRAKESIESLVGPCDLHHEVGKSLPSICTFLDPPTADCSVFLTSQRITYSYWRVDDIMCVCPLDMKQSQDPAPMAWMFDKETAAKTFQSYTDEYERILQEAMRVYP